MKTDGKAWHIAPPTDTPAWLAALLRDIAPDTPADVAPIIAAILTRRGITDLDAAARFIDPAAYRPASPYDLPDMEAAVNRLNAVIENGGRVLVWGDFDVDGQTSTALLTAALREMGANVRYYIPQRESEGHGIAIPRLDMFIAEGIDLLLTCDTGISAHDAINHATACGVAVIVTDHHQLPPTLPRAHALLNPQRLPADHPLHTLPGVGCAYKLIEALYAWRGQAGREAQFLDLVALGIVADVVVQTGDARYLLQRGLVALRDTARPGLRALYELAGINPALLDEQTIGFQIAPRLNAVGRLADANTSVEFLTTGDDVTARRLANQLEALNNQRRFDTESITAAALAAIDAHPKLLESPALVVARPGWTGGIIGIVANRLVERFRRPVLLLSDDGAGWAHGSARSVPGCDITAAIQRVADEHPDLIDGFGGHTMAAGLRLPAERVPELRRALGRVVGEMLAASDAPDTLTIDAVIPFGAVTVALADALRLIAPFGAGNPSPVFATLRTTQRSMRRIGRTGDHLRLLLDDEAGDIGEILWWRAQPDSLPKGRLDIAYEVSINEFGGERDVQATLIDFRAVDEAPETFSQREALRGADWRHLDAMASAEKLEAIRADDVLIWAEGASQPSGAVGRDALRPARHLVIWSQPPAPAVLSAALEAVNPEIVSLFALSPAADSLQIFVKRMAGFAEYTLNVYGGRASWDALGGAMAHRPEAVRAGMEWLAARGHILIDGTGDKGILIRRGDGQQIAERLKPTTSALMGWLAEARAYRAYYSRSDPAAVLGIPFQPDR